MRGPHYGVVRIMKRPPGGSSHLWRGEYVQRILFSKSLHCCLSSAIDCHGWRPWVCAPQAFWSRASQHRVVERRLPRPRRRLDGIAVPTTRLGQTGGTLRRTTPMHLRDTFLVLGMLPHHKLDNNAWSRLGLFAIRCTCSRHFARRRRYGVMSSSWRGYTSFDS